VEKLIRKRDDSAQPPLYFAAVEDLFDIIHRAHIATGHGGRDRMLKEVSKKYANIPRQAVELYKSLCEECQRKHKRPQVKGVVVKPILTTDLLSRCQVDLIDMQSLPSGEYKWILVYQDHFTKFVLLRPLRSKRATEVANQLVDIFLSFGAPAILQSDNGSEFTAAVIADVAKLWVGLKLVHGKPRQPQSQGSVERANGDIKDMLVAWMNDNKTTEWSWGLKFVQFMKNSSYHAGIDVSPFKAMFGVEAKVGLQSTSLPDEIIKMISSEEELIQITALPESRSDSQSDSSSGVTIVHTFNVPLLADQTILTLDLPVYPPPSAVSADTPVAEVTAPMTVSGVAEVTAQMTVNADTPVAEVTAQMTVNADTPVAEVTAPMILNDPHIAHRPSDEDLACSSSINMTLTKISETRKKTKCAQENQAERMLKRSRTTFVPADKGDSVMIPIPQVDRGRGDPRNLMGIVLERGDNDTYKIGVRKGVLKGRFSRNQFDVCKETFLSEQSCDLTNAISVREAVISESLGGGQGFVKCNCQDNGKKCSTNRCKCFKKKLKCNSRCHGSLSCTNKC